MSTVKFTEEELTQILKIAAAEKVKAQNIKKFNGKLVALLKSAERHGLHINKIAGAHCIEKDYNRFEFVGYQPRR